MVRSLRERLAALGSRPEIIKSALVFEDIERYRLPPDLTKITDTRRSAFVGKWGDVSVELDALPIDVLRARIVAEVEARVGLGALGVTRQHEENKRQLLIRLRSVERPRSGCDRYRRSVPVTTMSASRLPHAEQTSRSRQSGNGSLGTVPFGHLGSIKLDPMTASLTPDDKSNMPRGRVAERHRRAGCGRRGPFPSTVNLTCGRRSIAAAPRSRFRRAGLRKTRTILESGTSGDSLLRFVYLDPPGPIRSWEMMGLRWVFVRQPSSQRRL
jgi:hypothetical protein